MTPWHTILQGARTGLSALALGIGAALALGFGSSHFKDQLQEELQQQRQQIASLQSQLIDKQQEVLYLDEHDKTFRAIRQRGLLKAPHRESLVEQLIATHQALNLPDTLTYSLPPPQAMSNGTIDPASGQAAPPSPDTPLTHDIEITLRDIHEGELLALLKGFRRATDERFRVEHCLLESPTDSGLAATCTLRAFSLTHRLAALEASPPQ